MLLCPACIHSKCCYKFHFPKKVLLSIPNTSILFPVASRINCFFPFRTLNHVLFTENPASSKFTMSPSGGQLFWKQRLICFSHAAFKPSTTFKTTSVKFHLKSLLAFITIKCPSLPLVEMC